MDERLTKLEMKLAYAEETIVTLDQVVTDQAKEIALLTARLEKLEKRVTDLAEEDRDGMIGDQRPPHY
ncbi:MAG: SlyX family protein [Spirochaetales bacterium]|jgi:SlyX protein|nr:SlyX family protein [Spirochaetales bacterium]